MNCESRIVNRCAELTASHNSIYPNLGYFLQSLHKNVWTLLQISNSQSKIKHQLDATLCRFYFCRVTLHVSGASAHHQESLKLVQWPLVHVLLLQVSHHITLLGPKVSALIRWCDDLPAMITHVPVAAVLVLKTPDDGRLRPKHVEWPCRNKTCTVLHQVGVSFDVNYSWR